MPFAEMSVSECEICEGKEGPTRIDVVADGRVVNQAYTREVLLNQTQVFSVTSIGQLSAGLRENVSVCKKNVCWGAS